MEATLTLTRTSFGPKAGIFDFTNFRTGRSFRLYDGEHGLRHQGHLIGFKISNRKTDYSSTPRSTVYVWPARGPDGPGFRSATGLRLNSSD